MRFLVTVRKLNVTDGQTDRQTWGVAISPVPGPTAPAGDNTMKLARVGGKKGVHIGRVGPKFTMPHLKKKLYFHSHSYCKIFLLVLPYTPHI